MPSTPIFNLRYPDGGEVISAQAFKNLADDAETAIGTYQNPQIHVVTLPGSWEANPNAPLTFYRFGRLVIFAGEIYRTAGSAINCGNIPSVFRPTIDRIRLTTRSSMNSEAIALFTVNQNGQLTLDGANNNSTTPGYNVNGVYVGSE